jgi:hypothetical protein
MKRNHFFRARTAFIAGAVSAVAALAGCSSSAPLFSPDGRPTTQVQCSAAGTWDACMQQARGMCGGAFDVVRQTTEGGVRNLLFACKAG